MELWQYNAWCKAYQAKQIDSLVIQVQAAYLNAYWNGASKHKKSLKTVIKDLQAPLSKHTKKEPIDFEKVSKGFQQMEDLKNYGWYKC